MKRHSYLTPYGEIVYWMNDLNPERQTLVLLPGLTADHRLFNRQVAYFKDLYNLFVWDAPGHAASRPFDLEFNLADKATWLHEILDKHNIKNPVLVGQSMGGYVSQAFLQMYPSDAAGFVSIDSAPLQRQYVTKAEIAMLKRMEPVYKAYPWKALIVSGSKGCSTTNYGRILMDGMMHTYDDDPSYYAKLAGHGYKILADAMEADLPYEISCPAILICGKKDHAGSTKRYNKAWAKKSGLPIEWIPDAGHNSNTDKPEMVNVIIEEFVAAL